MMVQVREVNRPAVLRRDGWHCVKCGREYGLEVAHRVGKWAGGSDSSENLITLCATCHFYQPDDGNVEALEAYLAIPFSPLQYMFIMGWHEAMKTECLYKREFDIVQEHWKARADTANHEFEQWLNSMRPPRSSERVSL